MKNTLQSHLLHLSINRMHFSLRYKYFSFFIGCLYIIPLFCYGNGNCDIDIIGLDKVQNALIKDALLDYYTSESKGNFEKTYNYRSENFKKLVSYELYKSDMIDATNSAKLKKIEIINFKKSSKDENIFFVHIIFTDEILINVDGVETKGAVLHQSDENTKWGIINDKAIVYYPGLRIYFRTITRE